MMNPQFCTPLQLRPRFVPVIVRPTVPVGYTPFTQDHHSSPVHCVEPLFPFGLSPEAVFDSPTTSKTRRDLEQLGRPTEHVAEMIFELAAQKNGIRIGMDHSKAAGAVKQGDTFEDFKKIAERNGITVCPAGSKDASSVSTYSWRTPTPDDSQSGHLNRDHNLIPGSTSTPWYSVTRKSACISHSSVGNYMYYNLASNEKPVTEGQNAVNDQGNDASVVMETENNCKSSSSDELSCFKNKAAMSGIKVREDIDLVVKKEHTIETHTLVNEDTKGKQLAEKPAQSPQTVMDVADLAVRNEGSASNLEHAPGTCSRAGVPELVQSSSEENVAVEVKSEGGLCVDEDSDSKSKVENQEELALTHGMTEEAGVKDNNEGKTYDEVTTMENMVKTENVMVSLNEDVQIVTFEEIAHQKGMKVGIASESKTFSVTSPSVEEVSGNVEEENLSLNFAEEDAQIAKFEEMAWLNGIKVGKDHTGRLSDSCSESIESLATDNVQESESWTETYPFEEDAQIARFQEIARLKGIKVASSGKWSHNSSHSSLSPATSDDCLCHSGDEICQIVEKTKGDIFEKLAKRNGIKIGKSTVASDTLNLAGVSAEYSQVILNGRNATSSNKTAIVFSQAGTQTEVTTVDCHSQTCEKDLGLFKQSTEVQVDVVRDAFEEEFVMWKLDDNAAGDNVEMCYKELYFKERKDREELSESLQNEKDVSANTKHNHKRVMEQLKEELSTKTEETEKLKKDLKTLKKQKETEVKRISKELKSKEEELESTKGALQLKEVALESLRSIVKEQTKKLKSLEDQLEEMKTALLEANNNAECKTCLNSCTENRVIKETNLEEEACGGWTRYTKRKSKSPAFKPTQVEKARGTTPPGRVNGLCDIDLNSPPSLGRQYSGDPDGSRIANGLQSPDNGEIEVNQTPKSRAECHTTASTLQDLPRTSPQASSYSSTLQAEASRNPPVNDSMSPPLTSNSGGELRGSTISPSPQAEGRAPAQNSSFLRDGNLHVSSREPNADTAVPSSTVQQPLNAFFPAPPFPFQSIPTQVITQYLSSLGVQPNIPAGSRVGNSSAPLRRPPGLNTEPVPEEDPDQASPPAPPAGKLPVFDKLMDALRKRFPNKDRQDLIIDLRKAKAVRGAAGFKGMQITEVVKCVEDTVKDKEEA